MSTETTRAVSLVTSRLPMSSRIWPRTAGTITFLVWFWAASLVNAVVFTTCRYHSRPPSEISMAAATTYSTSSRRRDAVFIGNPPSAICA